MIGTMKEGVEMNAARKILTECESRGIRLSIRGDRLRVQAPIPLDDELRSQIT